VNIIILDNEQTLTVRKALASTDAEIIIGDSLSGLASTLATAGSEDLLLVRGPADGAGLPC
jgi:hypothetical protein